MAISRPIRRPSRRKSDKPNPIDVHVGSRVRLRRNMLGLSQEKLGDGDRPDLSAGAEIRARRQSHRREPAA